MKFNPKDCIDNVKRFSQKQFMINFRKEYEIALRDFFHKK